MDLCFLELEALTWPLNGWDGRTSFIVNGTSLGKRC